MSNTAAAFSADGWQKQMVVDDGVAADNSAKGCY
jgi:hypothetical protein